MTRDDAHKKHERMFFPSRINLALGLLRELAREKDAGRGLTLPEIKRRMGLAPSSREAGALVRGLAEAGLVGSEWTGTRPRYFYPGALPAATLRDLVAAAEGGVGLGSAYLGGVAHRLPPEMRLAAAAEERLSGVVDELLGGVALEELLG